MFTGIIEATGRVVKVEARQGDVRLHVQSEALSMDDVQPGDSIATSGVCLTVISRTAHGYQADVSAETLSCTTLSHWSAGTLVNLEKALTPNTRMGGHMVSGHVDGLGEVVAIRPEARSTRYQVRAPGSLLKYIAAKGSITVDGVSLTVNAVAGDSFDLNIIPHTAGVTSISTWRVGTRVNLEVDLLARYLERLLKFDDEAVPDAQPALSLERLRKAGFTGEP